MTAVPAPAREQPRALRALKQFARGAAPQRIRDRLWREIVARPLVAQVYFAVDPDVRPRRLHRGTDLVVDGFPRSANTYAVESLQLANPSLTMSHHLHLSRVLERAALTGVPTLLVVRHPDAAVSSYAQFEPSWDQDTLYNSYADFYDRLVPVADRMVVADFNEITSEFGGVVARLNERFGLELAAPDLSARDTIFQRVEDFSARHFGLDDFERKVARPSADERRAPRPPLHDSAARARALETYRAISGSADQASSAG